MSITYARSINYSSGTYDSTKNTHKQNYGVKIDQCIVDGLEITDSYCGRISGLVGSQRVFHDTSTVGDIQTMYDGEGNKLYTGFS